MFRYSGWLQTTPPLFLLLARGIVRFFGLSNTSLRLVPLAFAVSAAACMLAVARRVVSPAFAVVATALTAFNPTTIEYSRTLKQYSAEMAAAAVILLLAARYLDRPSRNAFLCLLAAFAVGLSTAYSTAFLVPGAALAVYLNGGLRRAALLVLTSGGVFTILYFFFIRPNLTPWLRTFWINNTQGLTPSLAVMLVAALLISIAALAPPAVLTKLQRQILLLATLPCLVLAAASAFELYPNSARTRLFALPGFFLATAILAEKLLGRWRVVTVVVWIAAVAFAANAGWKQVARHQNQPQEDFDGAIHYLRDHMSGGDMLLVHASAKEGFKLYTAMRGWKLPPAVYGETGQPCCTPARPSLRTAIEDLEAKIPRRFHGRIWVLYSNRAGQWEYTGLDEGQFWRMYLNEEGCSAGPSVDLPAIDVSALDCNFP